MSGWQKMETAPKDGTFVDLWVNGQRRTDYQFVNGRWQHPHGYPAQYRVLLDKPEAWMPRPSAPELRHD